MCYVPSSTKYTFIYNYCKPFPSTKYMNEYTFVYNTSTITALMAMSNTNCQKVLFIMSYYTNCFCTLKDPIQQKNRCGTCALFQVVLFLFFHGLGDILFCFKRNVLVVGETILYNLFSFFSVQIFLLKVKRDG